MFFANPIQTLKKLTWLSIVYLENILKCHTNEIANVWNQLIKFPVFGWCMPQCNKVRLMGC